TMFRDRKTQIETIGEIFEKARAEDGWDVDGVMLYSYYFIDTDIDKLESLGTKLENDGYQFIDIFELGDEETGDSTGEFLLHIDMEETHTPESLAERNAEFADLADEFGLDSYDGWEFGEVGDYKIDEFDEDEEED